MAKKNDTDKLIRDKIINQHKVLLEQHWDRIREYIDESHDSCIGIGFNTSLDLSSDDNDIKSHITFKQVQKDTIVEKFNPNQGDLDFDGEQEKPKNGKGKRKSPMAKPAA